MNVIKELRQQQRIKQADLAKRLNVAQSTVSGWENDLFEPSGESLVELAKIFDVSVDYLLGHSNIKKAPASNEASTNIDDEILDLLAQLTEANREKAIDHIQYLIDRQEGSANK